MSDTKRHKEEGKFNNKLLDYDNVSNGTQRRWDRYNFEVGRHRKQRNELKAKIHEDEYLNSHQFKSGIRIDKHKLF